MGFNPSFPDQYQPTDEVNAFQLVDDVGQYSNQSDLITNAGFPVLLYGKYILLHSGDDNFTGTDVDSPGWDNIANGNRGVDNILGFRNSRDFLRGGKENDFISGTDGGDDFLLGDADEDNVFASVTGNNILRGGRGNDSLNGANGVDLLCGDFGRDVMFGGNNRDYFMLRTDKVTDGDTILNNLSANPDDVDIITDFKIADDYIVLPGVSTLNEIKLELVPGTANDYYIGVIQPDFSVLYAGRANSDGALVDTRDIIVGDRATTALSAADGNDPTSFMNNPNIIDVAAI